MKNLYRYILAYGALGLCFLAIGWLFFRVLDLLTYVSATHTLAAEPVDRSLVARQGSLVMMGWVLLAGLALLVVVLVVEHYFRNAIPTDDLPRRIARVFSPVLGLFFLTHFVELSLSSWQASPRYWAIMLLELAGGALLLIFSFRGKPASAQTSS